LERVEAAPHVAVLVPPPAEALVQVTVTAEMGTVVQLVKVVAAEDNPRFQVLPPLPVTVQETVVVALPATSGESGSVAVKETVAGTTPRVKFAASGKGAAMAGRGAGTFSAGCPVPEAKNATMVSHADMGIRLR
jgi:hypothetical protein